MQIRIPFYSLHHSHVAYIYILIPEVDAISGEYRAADRSAGQTELKKKKKKKQMWTAGPEETASKRTTNKVFCGPRRFMFVRTVRKSMGSWGGGCAVIGLLLSSPRSRNQSRILILTSVMHGEHPTRRISLLIHASPGGGNRGGGGGIFEEGSMSGYHLSGDVMWADSRHTDNKKPNSSRWHRRRWNSCIAPLERIGIMCYIRTGPETPQSTWWQAKTNTYLQSRGGKKKERRLYVNALHLIAI